MVPAAANISRAQQPVGPHLPLNGEIPRAERGYPVQPRERAVDLRGNGDRDVLWPAGPFVAHIVSRKRVRHTETPVRVLKAEIAVQLIPGQKRRHTVWPIENPARRDHVVETGATADHRLLANTVGKTSARSEVAYLCRSPLAQRASRIAAVDDAQGRIRVYHRFLAGREARYPVMELRIGKERVPSQAQVQRQLGSHPPVVLDKQAVLGPAHVLILPGALNEAAGVAQQKVRQVGARKPASKRKAARLRVGVGDILQQPHCLASKDQLMRSLHLRHGLANGPVATVEVAEVVAVSTEEAGHVETFDGWRNALRASLDPHSRRRESDVRLGRDARARATNLGVEPDPGLEYQRR